MVNFSPPLVSAHCVPFLAHDGYKKVIVRKLYYVLWMKHKSIIVFLCCAGEKDVIALGLMWRDKKIPFSSPSFNVKILSKPDYFCLENGMHFAGERKLFPISFVPFLNGAIFIKMRYMTKRVINVRDGFVVSETILKCTLVAKRALINLSALTLLEQMLRFEWIFAAFKNEWEEVLYRN